MMIDSRLTIEVVQGNVLDFPADVLALKYAQRYFGADAIVSSILIDRGLIAENDLQPLPGSYVWVDPKNALRARKVLFVGVPSLSEFGYGGIEDFTTRVLALVAQEHPQAEHVAITLHGPGYGLDEIEALHAEVRGIIGAANAGNIPKCLDRVSIVEKSASRVERLKEALANLAVAPLVKRSPEGAMDVDAVHRNFEGDASRSYLIVGRHGSGKSAIAGTLQNLKSAEQVELKPRAFVAMPFAPEMEDVFYYGIQNPVRELGYVCERVDQEAFTGDILTQVKSRIEVADIVIADLTGANPNVYLEVGYAWGRARPTVLLIKKAEQMRFDVQGQRCLQYQSIKDLETRLTSELKNLPASKKP